MRRRPGKEQRRQEKERVGSAVGQAMLPFMAGALEAGENLRDLVVRAGLAAVMQIFAGEAAEIAGRKHGRRAERTANHWGRTLGEMVLGGRKVVLGRPRVRERDGREVTLPSVACFQREDPLTERVLAQIVAGVSSRKYKASLEALPADVTSRGTSRSAVSRRFVAITSQRTHEELGRRLDDVRLAALMADGITVAGKSVVVCLGIDLEGTKSVLGLRVGSTENAVLCTELLQDLIARGLRIDEPLLCVIDGGKGLRKALGDVLGDLAVIQRCQLHKLRNVEAQLPGKVQPWVLTQMREAYRMKTAQAARRQLEKVVAWLRRNGYEDAAASLKEGLGETLTVLALKLPDALTRSLSTTNAIENLMGCIRRFTRRVARWRGDGMRRRWITTAIIDTSKRFRRIKGCAHVKALPAALALHRRLTIVADDCAA